MSKSFVHWQEADGKPRMELEAKINEGLRIRANKRELSLQISDGHNGWKTQLVAPNITIDGISYRIQKEIYYTTAQFS